VSRTTIDYGIDLGTTNSAIAVLKGVTVDIIKNNSDTDITPSAVSIRKNALYVGERAKNQISDFPDDAFGEFKRRMGTDFVYQFKASGLSKSPEELSSEVLKSLKADVQARTGEVLEASVITVPAAFELHQCEGTRKAAALAGLRESPLLQEPVAAALAYGFQINDRKAYWLVYDFGGGTFDAAVIKSEEGTIQVVNHGGDNFLGGSDIDWAIVNQLFVPRLIKDRNLRSLDGGDVLWRPALAKLKRAAEIAKIELSRSDRSIVEVTRLVGPDSNEFEFEFEVRKADVIAVAEPFIRRSVEICQRVLREKNLNKTDIERVVLVGGPTLAPYFREELNSGLGIALDYSVDPLTVVARGAAIFAGTQRLSSGKRADVQSGQFAIDFKYQPVGVDSEPTVGGKVSGSIETDFTGFSVELINAKTKWSSGKIALRKDGVFITTLRAERGERNSFSVGLFDSGGRKKSAAPDTLTYTIGAVVDEQHLINSMGIATAPNDFDKFFSRGDGLPLKGMRTYHTVRAIQRGKDGQLIKIPVVEGENLLADRNRLVGSLTIEAGHITRDLPVGSEIEVTLRVDASRIITVEAYVPVLDEEFRGKLELVRNDRDPALLQKDFESEMNRFDELKDKASTAGAGTAQELISQAANSPLMREVTELINIKGNPDAAAKCEKRLLELKVKLDEAADALEWPSLIAEARQTLGYLIEADKAHGNAEQHAQTSKLAVDIERLARKERPDEELRGKIEQVRRLWITIFTAQPEFWVGQLQELEKQVDSMSDQARANRLLNQGRAFVSQNNLDGLRNVVKELWNLLPTEAVTEIQRGYQAGVMRVR
jgi:molecular chaperone DnaK